jgi:uncharacterized protein (DUF58 family)
MPSLSETSRYYNPRLLAQVGNMQLVARLVVEGMIAGLHRSPFHGFSVEFSEYRKYTAGDEIRHIDWKVWGKSDRLYIKRFEAETNLRAWLLLDASASMGYGRAGMTKLQYASYCAATLAYLMIRQQDAVGLVAFDETIRHFLPAGSTPQQYQNILRQLDAIEPGAKTDLSRAFHQLAERIRRRGLIIVFSDLFDSAEGVMRGLAHFRRKKHEVILFHVLDADEENFPFEDFIEFEDMETGQRMTVHGPSVAREYRKRFKGFLGEMQKRCGENAIEYVPLRTDQPLEVALRQYLAKRSRLG